MALLGMILGLVVALSTSPKYRARTTLQIEGFNHDYFLRDVLPMSPYLANALPEHYVQNQLKMLEGETLASRVAAKLEIKPGEPGRLSSWIGQVRKLVGLGPQRPMTAEEYGIKSIQRSLKVRTSLNSQVMEVLFDASSPEKATKGANLVTLEFMAMNLEQRWQRVRDTTEWLDKQTAELKGRLERASKALQDYGAASGLVFAGSGTETLAGERMRQLEESLGRALADRAAKEATYRAAAANPKVFAASDASGALGKYEAELQALRQQLADLRTVYTPAHQKVKKIEVQIAALEEAIERGQKDTLGKIQTELVAARTLEQQITQMHAQHMKRLAAQSKSETQYNMLKREVETTQELYDSMHRKVEEAGMAAALHSTNVRVIDPARPPYGPFSPKIPLNLALGLAFGVAGGVVLVVARERSGFVRRPGDAIDLNVPELGAIPSAKHDRDFRRKILPLTANDKPLELATWNQDKSLLSESFRVTLASILFSRTVKNSATSRPDAAGGRILVVTSVEAMEGKTTVAANLAIALAETNQRVLLIDADLRRPRMHSVFNLSNDWGIADLLQQPEPEDGTPLDALVRPTSIPRLWLVPSGSSSAAISGLLYSDRLRKLLRRYRKDFDLVLVDTPPMGLYADARVLGRLSDGVVIVVRANRTSRQSLRAAHLRLVQDQVPVLGTILNDWTADGVDRRAYAGYYRGA